MNKYQKIALGVTIAAEGIVVGCAIHCTKKEEKLAEQRVELERQKVENEKLYFEKLTPEQVETLEREKIEVRKQELELKSKEAELKKTVTEYKAQIQSDIEAKVMTGIHDDIRNTFDDWSTKIENRLENKIDNVVTRIDNLSDKYGGVKGTASTPSINVVNAPNN